MNINWHWPDTGRGSYYVAWYIILWRGLWFLPFLIVLGLGTLLTAMMYGPRRAARWFDGAS